MGAEVSTVTLFSSSPSISELSSTLQEEFNLAVRWVKINKLVLNKTKCIVFSNRYVQQGTNALHLSLAGALMEQVPKVKLLGMSHCLSQIKLIILLSMMDKGLFCFLLKNVLLTVQLLFCKLLFKALFFHTWITACSLIQYYTFKETSNCSELCSSGCAPLSTQNKQASNA